ncbi:MAG TPA: PEP/pyruvate-binding domain-containing protein [Anaerolineaceae bacterium]
MILDETSDILSFESERATLPLVGGKGANLARMACAGYPVPPGFLVTTAAYQAFLEANALLDQIAAALPDPLPIDPGELEGVSAHIRALFSAGGIPAALAQGITTAYTQLGQPPVAVRSSATAEDLPEMSFAGQQDTYLNVVGADALLEAVISCWASLWTGRAIGYRARNHVPQTGVSLAVVVQTMVESQASGVLFTANPLTGLRSETVIDATLGLGEALVSGQVEPDHYVVETRTGRIATKTLGAKAIAVHSLAGGGTALSQTDASQIQAIFDETIRDLVQLGQRVAELYGSPQDIEWAWANDRLYLLQSRPITSLFPVPQGSSSNPLQVLLSFGAVQGMLDPVTPLGGSLLAHIFAVGSSLFGIQVTSTTQTVLLNAGERLWVNLTPLLRNSRGRAILPFIFEMVEPTVGQAIVAVRNDPQLQPGKAGLSRQAAARIARFAVPMAGNLLLNLLAPQARRKAMVNRGERVLALLDERCAAIQGDPDQRLVELTDTYQSLTRQTLPGTFRMFVSGVAAGMASLNWLNALTKGLDTSPGSTSHGRWNDLVLEISRGVPNNPTTDMDLALWRISDAIRQDPASLAIFQTSSLPDLAVRFKAGSLPGVAQRGLTPFFNHYGGRGLAEIDAGRPRWSEDPSHVLDLIIGYLPVDLPDQTPEAVYMRSITHAAAAVDQLVAELSTIRHGWIKSRLARVVAGRARALLGLRESPKFFAVRMIAVFRRNLLAIGYDYAQSAELDQPDDLMYLSLPELKAFANDRENPAARASWRNLISHRRDTYRRELLRRQIPRLLLSDGRAFYAGMSAPANTDGMLTGSPVSAGMVEGRVRVVLDPRHADLQRGEILVCPGTDPSWTPLFLTAGGLVMEVGGMMTHGAVVAREYGIPAIVGVDQATQRLKTGQLIRIDGATGQIVLLEGKD